MRTRCIRDIKTRRGISGIKGIIVKRAVRHRAGVIVGIEGSPDSQPTRAAAGKFWSLLEMKGVDKSQVKMEYGWKDNKRALTVYKKSLAGERPDKVAKFVDTRGWAVYGSCWQTLCPGSDEQDALGKLK